MMLLSRCHGYWVNGSQWRLVGIIQQSRISSTKKNWNLPMLGNQIYNSGKISCEAVSPRVRTVEC